MFQIKAFLSFGDAFLGGASAAKLLGHVFGRRPLDPGQGCPEPKSVPKLCFSKLLGYVFGRAVGRQIRTQDVGQKVLQNKAFLDAKGPEINPPTS